MALFELQFHFCFSCYALRMFRKSELPSQRGRLMKLAYGHACCTSYLISRSNALFFRIHASFSMWFRNGILPFGSVPVKVPR